MMSASELLIQNLQEQIRSKDAELALLKSERDAAVNRLAGTVSKASEAALYNILMELRQLVRDSKWHDLEHRVFNFHHEFDPAAQALLRDRKIAEKARECLLSSKALPESLYYMVKASVEENPNVSD